MLGNLNELEKLGLAFLSGLVAGQSLEQSDKEVEMEENEDSNVLVGKIEGEEAKEFIKFIEKLGGNINGKCKK